MFKVPKHLSKEFGSLSTEGKEKFIRSYKVWYESDFTQELIKSLDQKIQDSVLKEEQEPNFKTLFESKYNRAKVLAERSTLRKLLATLNPNME